MLSRLRVGIGFLAATRSWSAAGALFFPAGFFSLEVVGMGMAYNEHLMRDYGAMTLASAVVLGVATVRPGRTLSVVALTMYLTWAVPHFVVHLTMLDRLTAATGALLMTALGLAIALSAVLLSLALSAAPCAGMITEPWRVPGCHGILTEGTLYWPWGGRPWLSSSAVRTTAKPAM